MVVGLTAFLVVVAEAARSAAAAVAAAAVAGAASVAGATEVSAAAGAARAAAQKARLEVLMAAAEVAVLMEAEVVKTEIGDVAPIAESAKAGTRAEEQAVAADGAVPRTALSSF